MIVLALRNLFRHRKRTAIALAAIGFGVIALLLAGGFIDWIFWGMREGAIQSRFGHIQITRPGYFTTGSADPFAYLLPDQLNEEEMIGLRPEVRIITPRLAFNGLISHGDVTIGFTGEGVDPEKEASVSQHLIITKGENLGPDDPTGLLLGAGLADNLGVTVGDIVVLLANTASGGLSGVEGPVRGLFQSASKAFDDAALRVPVDTARSLLRVSSAHSWVLLLDETEKTDEVLLHLQERFPVSESGLQFTPWYALADFYNKTVALLSRQMSVVQLIIALIIVLSISNTLVMSVLERTGETGTLMAIGVRRRRILHMFITEGLLLGVIGGLAGLAVGGLLATAISAVGIPMPPPPGMDVGFTGKILLTWPLIAGVMALAIGTTLLASLYPAWKASRLEIVNALRHNR
jgi:putative ABC transport system permease protein